MKQTLIALAVAGVAMLGVQSVGILDRTPSPERSAQAPGEAGASPASSPVQVARPTANQPIRATSSPVQARREAPGAVPAQATSAPPPGVVFVANTGGEGVFVRWTPSLDDKVKAYPDGARLEVVGPETAAEGITWLYVRAADGLVGWVPKQYTAVEPPAPAPPPA
jgi:hypothetical protein